MARRGVPAVHSVRHGVRRGRRDTGARPRPRAADRCPPGARRRASSIPRSRRSQPQRGRPRARSSSPAGRRSRPRTGRCASSSRPVCPLPSKRRSRPAAARSSTSTARSSRPSSRRAGSSRSPTAPTSLRIERPLPFAPAAVSGEGIAFLGADRARAAGFDGTGVSIAIFDWSFAGYPDRQASGDLPAGVQTRAFCATGLTGGTGHGTAVAEIVHEIAPAAELHLVCINSIVELGRATDYAIEHGIDVINMSGGFYNSGDGAGTASGVFAELPDGIARKARERGIVWVNAAGNDALNHWSGTLADPDEDRVLDFAAGDEGNTFPRRQWPHDVCLRPLARVGADRLQRLRPLRDLGGRHGRGGRRGGSAGLDSDRGGVLHEQRADPALLGRARPPGRRRIAPHRPLRPGRSRPRARRAQGQPARAGSVVVRPVGRRRLRAQRRGSALQRPRSRHRHAEAGSRGPGRGLQHDGGAERRVLVGLHRHVGGGASRRGVDRSAAGAVPRQLGGSARGARARLGARRRRPGPRPRHRLRRRAPGHRGSRGRRVDGVPARGRRRARQRARDVLGAGHGLLAVRPVGRLWQPDRPAAARELPGRRGRRRRAPVRPGRDLPRAHRRHERVRHDLRP